MGLAVMLLTQLGACCSICVVVVLTILLHEQDGTAGDTIGAVEGAAYHTYQNRATASIDCGRSISCWPPSPVSVRRISGRSS